MSIWDLVSALAGGLVSAILIAMILIVIFVVTFVIRFGLDSQLPTRPAASADHPSRHLRAVD